MRYVIYERTESGALVRGKRVSLVALARRAVYPHRETLQGWPERSVYWAREVGPSFGVAPIARRRA